MRHLPFLQALAEVNGTEDPVWRDASAGYLVLRFFDRWLEEGPARMSADSGLVGLRERIRSVQDVAPQVRDTLLKAIQEMVDAEEANPAVVSESLLEYGKYLESANRLPLAAHVYQTLIDVLDPPADASDSLAAATILMRYGYVARFLGEFDASDKAYNRAITLADESDLQVISFRARLGIANTLRARGNLGEAEAMLDQMVAEAVESKRVDAESWALNARAVIRDTRGRYVEAMTDFFRAYELTDDKSQQELILGDLAGCAWAAGYHQMARDAYRVLAYTAHEPLVRSAALGNLLECIAYDGNATEFERIRAHIKVHTQKHPLPVEHAIHIALYTANGVERFGSSEAAVTAYNSVITEARDKGFHQIAFKAEECLKALKAGTTMQDSPAIHEPPEVLRSLADTIAELSALAASS